jgi:hypothetical protein
MVGFRPLGQADFLCLALSEMIKHDVRDLGTICVNIDDEKHNS